MQYVVGEDIVIAAHRQTPRSDARDEDGTPWGTLTWKIVAIMYGTKSDKDSPPNVQVVVVPSDGKTTCYGGAVPTKKELEPEYKKTTYPRWKVLPISKILYVVSTQLSKPSKHEQEMCYHALCGKGDPDGPRRATKRVVEAPQQLEATTESKADPPTSGKIKKARVAQSSGTSKSESKGVDHQVDLHNVIFKAHVERLETQLADLKNSHSRQLKGYQDGEADLRKEILELQVENAKLKELRHSVFVTYQTMNHLENSKRDKTKRIPMSETLPYSLHPYFVKELELDKSR